MLHQLDDLVVFLLIVLDFLGTVRDVLFHRGIDVHLLRDGMPHDLGDQGISQVPPLAGIRCAFNLTEKLNHFLVIAGEDVDHIRTRPTSIGFCHETDLLGSLLLSVSRAKVPPRSKANHGSKVRS